MRYIKNYQEISERKESPKYDIYDWFEDLKRYQWGHMQFPMGELKKYSDIFIGKGYFEKIEERISKINNSLDKVDIDYINDRLYEIFDEYSDKTKYVMKSVLYGDYENYDSKSSYRYSGSISYDYSKSYNHLILHMIKEIIYPTLYIGYPSIKLRMNDSERYVTDEKYQCCNFDISKYHVYNMVLRNSVMPNNSRISTFDLSKKNKYNTDNLIDMYRPGIYVSIGGGPEDNIKMNLRQIESQIDKILPSILHDLDYEEVIFDNTRGDRKYDDNIDIQDYTFKILLKL